ncbi:MAG: ABC transporter ATP-binding protein/permease [Ruminococcaceae bacterium]|nr:ABC transporter ATP-binding protein/permease [Oscillospiraceae bacterium]
MLELIGIKKEYPAGNGKVEALRGINLKFRKSEFVSILGPSGCGKTTMLNIIGGLDQYTEGDLIINGESTKNFGDRNWDTYRNHSIGFVFQNYNLIPHQTVLQNVELALTLSGVSKNERRERAKKALHDVGLSEHIYKRPSEMSGGQMQRVAIARALVNNPDIILADEPTGALDTETSLQVMEILKEVARDRLVIMVTHNPDLANRYSTRIINMLDGVITDDSMPVKEDEELTLKDSIMDTKKPSMSLKTSFGLSLKNLFTKKGRTLLTAFAGSIGIIGIALIYALSQGFTTYIDEVQESTLSSYPLTIESSVMDMSSLMQTFMGISSSEVDHELDKVYVKPAMYNIIEAMNNVESEENDLKSFKAYIEKEKNREGSELKDALNGVQYSYDINLLVYTETADGKIIYSDTQSLLQELALKYMGIDFSSMMSAQENMMSSGSSPMSSFMTTGGIKLWQEMLPGKNGEIVSDLVTSQYDLIYGAWPNDYNEVVLVLDENNELDDMTLYALGLSTEEEAGAIIKAASQGSELERNTNSWSYGEICDREYKVILNSSCYTLDENTGLYTDMRQSDAGVRYLYANAMPLKVVGIIRPNEESDSHMLTGSIAYTSLLTEYIIENNKTSTAIDAQLQSSGRDIFTGKPFSNSASVTDEMKIGEFKTYISSLNENEKAELYKKIMSIPDENFVSSKVEGTLGVMTREEIENTIVSAITSETGTNPDEVKSYVESMSDADLDAFMSAMILEQIKMQYALEVEAQLSPIPSVQLALLLDEKIASFTSEDFLFYYDKVMDFSESSFEGNLKKLGYVDIDSPSTINLYASSFENKDVIEEVIEKYNEGVEEISKIKYVDYIGLMMSSITTIINTITYVLIAFVAISLIVSSIMIGVITLISVQERTKEIGILRAIGASKRDVSTMFNAETILIGFASGLLGVLVTYALCIPINAVIHALTGITNLSAYLPLPVALVLILISVILTLFSGIIPSRSAAKKDPVVALRTE